MGQTNGHNPASEGGETPRGSQRDAGNADRKNLEIDKTQIHRTDTRGAEGKGDKGGDKGRTQGLPTKSDADQAQVDDADAKRVAESSGKQNTPDRSVGPRGIDGAVAEGVEEAGQAGNAPDNANRAW